MKAALLIVTALLALSLAQNPNTNINSTLGNPFGVHGQTSTKIVLADWLGYFEVFTSADANVTITAAATLISALPSQYTALVLNSKAAFTITVQPSSAFVRATFVSGELSAIAKIALALSGKRPAVLYYYTNQSAYIDVDVQSYSSNNGFNVNLPFTGFYVIATVDNNAVNPAVLGASRFLKGAERNLIQFFGLTNNTFLSLNCSVGGNASLIVNQRTSSPFSVPKNLTALNVFYDIDLDVQTSVNATIIFQYFTNQFANISNFSKRIVWAYYDTTKGVWVVVKTTVDVNRKTISTDTTHFSSWGLYASDAATDTAATTAVAVNSASSLVAFVALIAAFVF